jgi:putative ABC transport system permease protein
MGNKGLIMSTPKWRRYLRFFGPDLDADINDELAFHIETKERELIAQGCTPDEARRRAVRHFGNIQEFSAMCRAIDQETTRKRNALDRLADFGRDLRTVARGLRRAPTFSLVAVLTLSAGIGGATALFSMIDSWIIRAVRFPEPDQLAYVRSLNTRQGRETSISPPDFRDLRERTASLLRTPLAAWSWDTFTLSIDAQPERIPAIKVSDTFFATTGVQPVLGRAFNAQEFEFGRHQVAVVSHGFWKARFNGDPGALGSKLELDGEPYTIVGVLPEDFHFTVTGRTNLWVPLALPPEETTKRQSRSFHALARMKPGVTIPQLRDALNAAAADLAKKYPDTNQQIGASCMSLAEEVARHTGAHILWVVFAVALGLLLIACSNVANLLLVRAQARQREASIQVSLGAGRGTLVRRALLETIMLFLAAGALGAAEGYWMINFVVSQIDFENRGYLPGYGNADMNLTVLMFALGISLFTGLLFGLAPAFESMRANVMTVLKESGSSVSQSTKAKRTRFILVASQIALAAILVSSTMILVRDFSKFWTTPPGFEPHGVLTFKITLNEKQYPDANRRRTFFEAASQAIAQPLQPDEPSVSRFIPFGEESGATSIRVVGAPPPDPTDLKRAPSSASFNAVSPSYFATLRIPLLGGRVFTKSDSAESTTLVAIVSDSFVTRYLRNVPNPIGQRIAISRLQNREAEIVGIVKETREDGFSRKGNAQIYVPFAQAPTGDASFSVRADPSAISEFRRRIAAIDPMQPIYKVNLMEHSMSRQIAPYRLVSGMLGWFGGLALLLAAVGVYGVVAYSATQRTREIGIRAALGAGRQTLLRMFVRQGLIMLQAGMIPGILGGIAASVALRSVFEDMTAASAILPLTITAGLLGLSVILATIAPAWRAASTDPLLALRYDG